MQDASTCYEKAKSVDQRSISYSVTAPILQVSNITPGKSMTKGLDKEVAFISDDQSCDKMSNEQHFQRQYDAVHSPQPPPFNPLQPSGSTHTHAPSPVLTSTTPKVPSFPNSIASDLMKVYESMTQSSTPDTGTPQPGSHSEQHYHQGPSSQPSLQYQYSLQQQYPSGGHVQPHYNYVQSQPQHQGYYQQPGHAPPPGAPAVPQIPEYPSFQELLPASEPLSNPPASEREGRSLRNKRSLGEVSSEGDKGNSKTRKKAADSDGRWSKRFTWPDDLHRDFVSAIFDVGLKHSSPSAILDHMPSHEPVTSERIKSHLQKYRLHRSKAKKEFMTCYDASMKKFQAGGLDSHKVLAGGEGAAHASFVTMAESDETPITGEEQQATQPPDPIKSMPTQEDPTIGALVLPKLSEEEKRSPIGTSLGYLLGLFFSIRSQLMTERAAAAAATHISESGDLSSHPVVGDLYTQFANDRMPGNASQHDSSITWSTMAQGDTSNPSFHGEASHDPNTKAFGTSTLSTRTNLEENTLMQREMQNQRLLQNKMRALKQQELEKYKKAPGGGDGQVNGGNEESKSPENVFVMPNSVNRKQPQEQESEKPEQSQGAGEVAGPNGDIVTKERAISVGNEEDFWNTDVVDEQLFEFLMNP